MKLQHKTIIFKYLHTCRIFSSARDLTKHGVSVTISRGTKCGADERMSERVSERTEKNSPEYYAACTCCEMYLRKRKTLRRAVSAAAKISWRAQIHSPDRPTETCRYTYRERKKKPDEHTNRRCERTRSLMYYARCNAYIDKTMEEKRRMARGRNIKGEVNKCALSRVEFAHLLLLSLPLLLLSAAAPLDSEDLRPREMYDATQSDYRFSPSPTTTPPRASSRHRRVHRRYQQRPS